MTEPWDAGDWETALLLSYTETPLLGLKPWCEKTVRLRQTGNVFGHVSTGWGCKNVWM